MLENKQVEEYFKKYVLDKEHASQVMFISLRLFDDIQKLLNIFNEKDRELLYISALLHDIGYFFENKVHNKDGRDFILNNNILDYSLNENIIIANIIRYHRGKLPKPTHSLFMNLDKEIQFKTGLLAGICKLADGLDASHLSVVKSIDFYENEEKNGYILKVYSQNPRVKKIIKAKEKKDLLELYLEKKITVLV